MNKTFVNKTSSYDGLEKRTSKHKSIYIYEHDLPESVLEAGIKLNRGVAIDTEATGLKPTDRLCLVQLNFGDGISHLVRVHRAVRPAPNIGHLLERKDVEKIMHYAQKKL